jgi:uncharacterized protein (TIGR02284 family)
MLVFTTGSIHIKQKSVSVMENNIYLVNLLNKLLAQNCDARRGYHKTAIEIDQPVLKGWVMSLAEQRENFKKSIKEEIRFLGGEPVIFHQLSGKIQQTYANPVLLQLLCQFKQVLEECLLYESNNLAELDGYLQQQMPSYLSTRDLVIGQRENIKVALADLKAMLINPTYSV